MDLITSANSWKEFENALSSLGKTEKGRAFEELTRLHLLTDPTFATKIKKIWHHSDVPQKIVDELGLQRPEIGVDLVARVMDGSYWAIQCKFHQDRTKNVTYDELSTFFSITERKKTFSKLTHRLVCTSANGISHRVDKAHPEKLGYLTSLEFSKLGKEQFDAFRELLGGGHPAPKPYDPRTHQKIAVEKVKEHFKDTKTTRGKIIHPCGSGKSLTGYWISQALKSKKVIIAVPSLALVRQTLGAWTREAVANNVDMDWIAVCSDDDVKNSDDPSMHKVDLGIEVDTDPEVVAAFLSKRTKGTKVLITTYQSGQAVSEGVKKAGITFDLGIYDEAHKTVGQKDKVFAHLLYDENVKVKKRVFMTATERQFRGNSDEYLSMDDEDMYGTVIDELSFKAALEQDPPILSDYRIVTTIITKNEIADLINNNNFIRSDGNEWSVEGDASTFASLIALRKLIKERGIKHSVSFHNSIKRSKYFMELNAQASAASGAFEDLKSFHVSGKDSTGVRAAILERFIDAEPSLITNARCLTEGVDVPAIDAVLFADPKQSKIDIVQAAGRALRRFPGKDFGYIIVPVVLDDEAEEPSDDAFTQIIAVISALGMHDERIIEEFKLISNGRRGGRGRIVDIDVPDIVRVKFEDFISNVEIQIWDRLSFGWHKGFEELKKYVEEHGVARIPSSNRTILGFNLGSWVSTQRRNYWAKTLKRDQITMLERLPGWVWNEIDAKYQDGISNLDRYIKEKGNSNVPATYKTYEGYNLGSWVFTKRAEYKNGKLSDERISALESKRGWVWVVEDPFEENFVKLELFVEKQGHSQVPGKYITEDGFKLGSWVGTQRRLYRSKSLPVKKEKQLENLPGWVWDVSEHEYGVALIYLSEFRSTHGHLLVPSKHTTQSGFKLGAWVVSCRTRYKSEYLSPKIILSLESLEGWIWDTRDAAFDKGLLHLREYNTENGSPLVPKSYKTNDGFPLGHWVRNRRTDYRKGALSKKRISDLESLVGWMWEIENITFEEGLRNLLEYFSETHSANPPASYVSEKGYKLGAWVSRRRTQHKNGKLSQEKIDRLESLPGWKWNTRSHPQKKASSK